MTGAPATGLLSALKSLASLPFETFPVLLDLLHFAINPSSTSRPGSYRQNDVASLGFRRCCDGNPSRLPHAQEDQPGFRLARCRVAQ